MLDPPGEPAAPAELQTTLGRSLASVLDAGIIPFVSLRGTRRDVEADVVLVDVVPELPQDPVTDIRQVEPIAIRVGDQENWTPEVFALRDDFPRDLAHLNVTDADCPWPSLCLYENAWEDVRLHLTAPSLLGRAQDWLGRSARGDLHDPDQPLEAFVSPLAIPLVLPPSLKMGALSGPLSIEVRGEAAHTVLVATESGGSGTPDHLAFVYRTGPAKQAALRQHPSDLRALHTMLEPLDFDLVATLRAALLDLEEVRRDPTSPTALSRPVLVLAVPLLREVGGDPEREQVFGYHVGTSLLELGKALGIWSVVDDGVGLQLPTDNAARGQGVSLTPVRPVIDITPETAQALSGVAGRDLTVAVVGVGALGSQVVMNLVRSGLGRWTVIDEDSLLPHNLVRHVLPRPAIGFPKAEMMALFVQSIVSDGSPARALVGNVLDDGRPEIRQALREADLVLDVSASAPVGRALAEDVEGVGRCISLFLNPTGTDLVVLVEDAERRVRIDGLEMQYLRALSRDPFLKSHLQDPAGRVRYGTSCRDVTVRIPQDQVAVAAGIGARAVRMLSDDPGPALRIWRMDPDLSATTVAVEVHPVLEVDVGNWRVISDDWVLQHLAQLRRDRLPNETGGVLLGFHDVSRRRLYIADALPAPADSTERPVYFDRGCLGLRERIREIESRTGGALSYVGEWHSHPGRSTAPSGQDREVFDFLATHMAVDGLPPLMVIVGDRGLAVFADSMNQGVRAGGG